MGPGIVLTMPTWLPSVCLAPYARQSIADAGAVEALVEAQAFASDNHASLANMADRAIDALR